MASGRRYMGRATTCSTSEVSVLCFDSIGRRQQDHAGAIGGGHGFCLRGQRAIVAPRQQIAVLPFARRAADELRVNPAAPAAAEERCRKNHAAEAARTAIRRMFGALTHGDASVAGAGGRRAPRDLAIHIEDLVRTHD